ncbi:unnamed protein product [Medioppia subpectinata]|uniref:Caspase family p20 domain-containing protein n=1 Tax=Medioppia subpectinata TaxID=1979941 RepID=A0A7R9Q676_9ACAR|nr:unnamed protein product [Medioppia subpectinata]CAG2113584.1 unnamed protein product [Medioppia subpectinata]
MDQEGPRAIFNEKFHEFIKGVQLNDQFMDQLKEHPCKYLLQSIENFDDVAKKCRIFSEFTLVRDNTEQLAVALELSGQKQAADQLRLFNLSERPWPYSHNINLTVVPARALRSDTSKQCKMETKPRGVALVFVTIPELYNEAERFRSIYEQLEFTAYLHQGFSRDEIFAELTDMAQSKGKYAGKYKGDAFIMMFIGHGFNESIIGWSAQPQWPPADDTVLPIRDIMTMFSETGKCRALREKIKIFIFNCCRETFVT